MTFTFCQQIKSCIWRNGVVLFKYSNLNYTLTYERKLYVDYFLDYLTIEYHKIQTVFK